MVKLKRVYEPAARGDGFRVLVERLWPRGLRKQDLELDDWVKEIAPSSALRKWFGHQPERWSEFKRRYVGELKVGAPAEHLSALIERASAGRTLTLLFSSHDVEHNNAVVLKNEIERRTR